MTLADQQLLDQLRNCLMQWYNPTDRPMPWKEETDPYLIWLSEIILQQTRVAQGLPYYERFRQQYPTVTALANAPDDEVMKLWEGLGYYSRARHLLAAARLVRDHYAGVFPATYTDIRELPGVGPYTAAAIASFAHDLPHAVVDGNVYRVLARYLADDTPIDSTAGKHRFNAAADYALDHTQPGRYNQAIMDLGATVCTPRQPRCTTCPLRETCRAYATGEPDRYPVKTKKIRRRQRHFHYIVIDSAVGCWLHKRGAGDVWQDLYEFPLIEHEQPTYDEAWLRQHPQWQSWLGRSSATIAAVSPPRRQDLTHQRIVAVFWEVQISGPVVVPADFITVERKNLANFAFPRIIDAWLGDKSLYLKLI